MRLAVLASGTGSILEAILAAELEVCVVVVDRPCRATEVAESSGVPAVMVERQTFGKDFDRVGYTKEIVAILREHGAGVVAMAGFGTILEFPINDAYPDRILNTHPALLPAFKGWHAVEEALAYGVKVTGWTVHLVTPEVDGGPILAQEAVPVFAGDTVESLHERIKAVERRMYPLVIAEFMAGQAAGARPNP